MPEEEFLSIRQLSEGIRKFYGTIERFKQIKVRGECSGCKVYGNYIYFDIKEVYQSPEALLSGVKAIEYKLSCKCWDRRRLESMGISLQDGMDIGISGKLEYYSNRNESQLIVDTIEDLGEGEAERRLRELTERLRKEGIFDEEHKKPLPKYPRRIGVVTSGSGAVKTDIWNKIHERNPYVAVVLYPVTVQGPGAPESIVKGIRVMDQQGFDLLIVGRGGGAAVDLSPFNDEQVVRTVYEAQTPIVSGVGHAPDHTLIDDVADLGCTTPTSAAERSVPVLTEILGEIEQKRRAIRTGIVNLLKSRVLLLDAKRQRLEQFNPAVVLEKNKERLTRAIEILDQQIRECVEERQDHLTAARELLDRNIKETLEGRKHRCEVIITRLHGLSPTAKLMGGFGYISVKGKPVTTVDAVKPDGELEVRVHDGEIRTKVVSVRKLDVESPETGGSEHGG
ncbi:MAG: exodeoxyribonuclease VII large subunit [Eubacterium sp.]|nr:exodeoxyribonuclease VII large subunit [Eubacterium sp.]